VSDIDPFSDMAFSARLQKLISMLGSEQPGEAEAARRKLLEHLGHHRLSLTDVAMRLREIGGRNGASFTQGARELSLERQLTIARAARQEAESEAHLASQHAAELQAALQAAAFDVGRALQGQAQARFLGAFGWLAAAIVSVLAITLHNRPNASAPAPSPALVTLAPRPIDPELAALGFHPGLGERLGTVLVQDLPVRLRPDDQADVRAFLNRGTRVVVEQQTRVGTQIWLQIRSVTGSGWVRGAAVLK
jgi:hypothetical protein